MAATGNPDQGFLRSTVVVTKDGDVMARRSDVLRLESTKSLARSIARPTINIVGALRSGPPTTTIAKSPTAADATR